MMTGDLYFSETVEPLCTSTRRHHPILRMGSMHQPLKLIT